MNYQTETGGVLSISFRQSPLRRRILACVILLLLTFTACSSARENDNASAPGIIVINAPASGEVLRIVTPEGVHVNQGTPVIEIAVQNSTVATTTKPGESAEAQAIRNYQAADAEIEAARAEAVRHGGEVERLTPLVASGQANQGELDGERALYEGAQRRLQLAQNAKRNAEGGLLAARQPTLNRGNTITPEPAAQTVSAVATSPGTVAVISARVGEKVKLGQPLATIRADQ
jgi:multidrug resistance efflux pump